MYVSVEQCNLQCNTSVKMVEGGVLEIVQITTLHFLDEAIGLMRINNNDLSYLNAPHNIVDTFILMVSTYVYSNANLNDVLRIFT